MTKDMSLGIITLLFAAFYISQAAQEFPRALWAMRSEPGECH